MNPPRRRQLERPAATLQASPTRARSAPQEQATAAGRAPVDGYVRVSRINGRAGERFISPDVQEEQIRAYARARGLTIATVFCELDRSGATLQRELLQTALKRIESGQSGGLIVARLDRFARTALEALEAIARIQRAGGDFVSVEDGLDSSTPFGKAMMTILLALAELKLGRVKDNWRDAQAHAVQRGIHVTGRLPLGYQRDPDGRLLPIPALAPALRAAFVQRGFGALPGQIVEELRRAGVGADHAGKTLVTLRAANYALRNPVYTGEARCGDLINPTAHPPIVDRSLWLAAQHPRTRTSFNRNAQTLLAGLVRCGSCGGPLKRRKLTSRNPAWTPEGAYAYYCWQRERQPRCTFRTCIANDILEPFTVKAFFSWLEKLDRPTARTRLAEAEALVVEADTDYGHALAFSPFDTTCTDAKHTSEQAWLKLAALARLALVLELPDADTVRRRWPSMTVKEQRRLLSAAVDTITVAGTDASHAKSRTRIRFVGDPPSAG